MWLVCVKRGVVLEWDRGEEYRLLQRPALVVQHRAFAPHAGYLART